MTADLHMMMACTQAAIVKDIYGASEKLLELSSGHKSGCARGRMLPGDKDAYTIQLLSIDGT